MSAFLKTPTSTYAYGCTGKVRYQLQSEAWKAAERIRKRCGPINAYKCRNCEGWHLTHYSKEHRRWCR